MPETKPLTAAQPHAKACITCGSTGSELLPAGHISIENRPGQSLVWPVVSCPEHQTRAAS